MQEQSERKKKFRLKRKPPDSIPAFLLKTYGILENPQYQNIISWTEDGTAFIVKRVNEFSEQVLPRFFKHRNFASFVRQLNMYDFHKNRKDNNENEFKHKFFQRGFKQFLLQIKRKSFNDEPQPLTLMKTEPFASSFHEFRDLVSEMALLSHKQVELERLIKIIIKQNEKFQKENKYLWGELIKNKQKNEMQNDRLMLWFLQQLANKHPKPNQVSQKQFASNRLMIKQNDILLQSHQEDSQNGNQLPFQEMLFQEMPFYKQEIESVFENLSNKQIIQGLVQALQSSKSSRGIDKFLSKQKNKIFSDESHPQSSDGEDVFKVEQQVVPFQQKKKYLKQVKKEEQLPFPLNESHMQLAQEPPQFEYDSNQFFNLEDQFLNRKDSLYQDSQQYHLNEKH